MENDIFWSEIGPGFGEPAGTLHQEFSGVALSPPPLPLGYCHTKNIETTGNLVHASKDDRKKKRDFRKKSAKYMTVCPPLVLATL